MNSGASASKPENNKTLKYMKKFEQMLGKRCATVNNARVL